MLRSNLIRPQPLNTLSLLISCKLNPQVDTRMPVPVKIFPLKDTTIFPLVDSQILPINIINQVMCAAIAIVFISMGIVLLIVSNVSYSRDIVISSHYVDLKIIILKRFVQLIQMLVS